MTAEELRVGNYVNYKTFTITHPDGKRNTEVNREKVKVLAVDGHNNRVLIKPKSNRKNYTWVPLGRIEPIFCTKEVFLDCDLKRYISVEDISFILGNFKAGWFSLLQEWAITTVRYGDYITGIRYLHQLQNLYFALHGEELIKDEI